VAVVILVVVCILPAEAFITGVSRTFTAAVSGVFTEIAAFSSVIVSTMIVFLVSMGTHGGGIGAIRITRITLNSRARIKSWMKTKRIRIVSGGALL